MSRDVRLTVLGITVAWAALFVVSLLSRSLFPIDETRYAAVAWEMWHGGHRLVPHLNGVPYSDKPPLLFWLIGAGWSVFGVRPWWARLVPSLFALGGVYLVIWLARRLWPDRPGVAMRAGWITAGSLIWALFETVLMFDALVALLTLAGMAGMVLAWRGRRITGWGLVALSIGLGILAKGPVILAYILPVGLLGPWWARNRDDRPRTGAWYAALVAAVVGGAALALAWALPAAARGGPAYADAILWGQTAHRVVGSFAHRRAWWAYLVMLPLVLLPWTGWVPAWTALRSLFRRTGETGRRLCLAWAGGTLVILSLISGKQPHYLLPLIPAVALLLGSSISEPSPRRARVYRILPAVLVFLPGILAEAFVRNSTDLPPWFQPPPWWPAMLLAAGAAVFLAVPPGDAGRETRRLAAAAVFTLVVMHLGFVPAVLPANDLSAAGAILHRAQEEGHPVANAGHYNGQFHFAGRLTEPIVSVNPGQVANWAREHPDGLIVTYARHWRAAGPGHPLREQPYRSHYLAIWRSDQALIEAASPSPRWE